MSQEMYEAMTSSVIDGEVEDATHPAQQALQIGIDPLDAKNKGFVKRLDNIGKAVGWGEMFLPDLEIAAEAMKAVIAELEPEMERHCSQRYLLEETDDSGLRNSVKVIVGGAPVTRSWADEIGADGYSEDAISPVNLAQRLLDAA